MRTSLVILIMLVITACNSKSDSTPKAAPQLKVLEITSGGSGDHIQYYHILMMSEYEESRFNDYDFIYLADKYLMTLKSDTPVSDITFVKPLNFKPDNDHADEEKVKRNFIVSISYTYSTMHNKTPQISSVSFWDNGVEKVLMQMSVPSRERALMRHEKERERFQFD